jgi:membrane associated rhomboid family serine protease
MGNMQETKIVLPTPGQLLTPGVMILLSLMVAGFIGFLLIPNTVINLLALNPRSVVHGYVWQLVTYPFVESCAWRLVFNGLILLFIGSAIEREWRQASLLWLWLIVSVCSAILWVLVTLIAGSYSIGYGATACAYGLIATMGVIFRDRWFLVYITTVKGQHLAIGLIVIGIIVSLPSPIMLIWVAGALIAYGYIKLRWSLAARASARPTLRQSTGKGQFVDID